MFESNFPVDKGSYGYGVFWNACKRLAEGASAAEKASLFSGTASKSTASASEPIVATQHAFVPSIRRRPAELSRQEQR